MTRSFLPSLGSTPLLAFACAYLASPLVVDAQQTPAFDFSIKNIMRGPELYGRPPENVRWSADNKWIYFTWVEAGKDWREQPAQYRVRAVPGAKPERVSIQQVDSTGPQFAQGDRSHNGRFSAVEFNGDIFINDLTTGAARRLTQTVAAERSPRFSARDDQVFFVRDNNVYSIDLATGFLRQFTDIRGGPEPTDSARAEGQRGRLEQQQRDLFESVRDRIRSDSIARAERLLRESLGLKPLYLQRGEEVATFSVSPNARTVLVATRLPAQPMRGTEIPQYVTRSGYTEDLRARTKVGDSTGNGRLGVITLPAGTATWLKPFGADTTGGSFTLIGWNDAGTRALVQSRTRDNKTRLTQLVDLAGGLQTIDSLRDSAWVGGPCGSCIGWYDSGRRVWFTSEADGFSHLYTVLSTGADRKQLTSGRWEVRDVSISTDGRSFYLTTNEVSPFEEHLYRLPVGGGDREKITTRRGKHDAVVSDDGQLIADVYSYVNRPPELFLLRNRAGAEMSQITTSPSAEWLSFPWIAPELVMIPGSDGVQVPAHIYRPSDMKAQPNGAGVIFVHGAGYLHNVGHFWSSYPREYMFHQFLASRGYTVLDLDYRGSDGYGRDWRTAIYRFMGGRDLQDQVDASKYLTKNFGIEPERVGLYGGSYGGFITLMALFTEQEHFGAGAALRSVTDWAHYNQRYTSNILNLPQQDTLAYRRSSPIYFAEGLEDPLLMAHGMVDVNVHFQDIVRLTQRLIELGKTRWELAAYPVEDHAFVRPSSWTDEYRRIFELFERWLPTGAPRK
ncbi:MAG: prolyl oligopeptidase family serine peptidase [Gemmatimonadota bacterium]|nr:prolyl oligopeptidase family serine peptidase [Gemmatimonadota bacterium]